MAWVDLQRRLLQVLKIGLGLLILFAPSVAGQEPAVQPLTAAPPPKVISKEDRAQLDAAKDIKGRIRLTIQLADNHLKLAEQYTSQSSFEPASREIGKYHALMDDALKFLGPLNHDSNKTRDLYKRLELALRSQGPRLTAMRRITPLAYAVWIKEVEEFARSGRTEALNSFYGHTVVRENQQKPAPKQSETQTKDGSRVPEKKP